MTAPLSPQDHSCASNLPWLGDLLPFDVFLKTANYLGSDREFGTSASQARFSEHMEVLEQVIQGFFAKLLDGGHLWPIENTERRGNRYANTWNEAVAGDRADRTLEDLAIPVAHDLLHSMCRVGRQIVKNGDDPKPLYDEVMQEYSNGHFRYPIIVDSSTKCSSTGVPLNVVLGGGWRAVLAERRSRGEAIGSGFEYIPVGPAPEDAVRHVSIPAPSGKMLAADWFRLDGNAFTEAVSARDLNFDINTGFGMRQQTEHYAREHGFLSVFVGNTSPSVFRQGQIDVIGNDHFEGRHPSPGKPQASFCTDLWWATVIDAQILRELLIRHHGEESGSKAFDAFIKEGDYQSFEVPRGVYHAHFTDLPGRLVNYEAEGADLSWAPYRDVYCVLGQQQLQWRPRVEPVADAGPKNEGSPAGRRRGMRG